MYKFQGFGPIGGCRRRPVFGDYTDRMAWVSIVSFCVAGAILLETVLRRTDFFSPVRIYLFFHSLTLGIAFLALHRAMTPWKPLTVLVYAGSAASYVAGAWIAGLLGAPGKPLAAGDGTFGPVAGPARGAYNWNLHFYLATGLFAIFLAGMLVAASGIGGFPLFMEDKGEAIQDFFKVNLFASIALSYGGVAMAMFFVAIFRPASRSRLRDGALWMTVLTFAIFLMALSRSGIIFFAFFALVYYHQAVRRIPVTRLGILFAVFLSIFVATAYFKLSNYQKRTDYDMKPWKAMGVLFKVPYVYVANNFWNLDYALNAENHRLRHPPTYGFTTVSGLLDMMQLPGGAIGPGIRQAAKFDDQFHVSASKVKGLNTIGYQWGLYKDFGVAGTFLFPFAFALLFGDLYRRMRLVPTVANRATYAFLAYFVGFSWFLAFWESMIYVYGLLFVAFACWLCGRAALPATLAQGRPRALPGLGN